MFSVFSQTRATTKQTRSKLFPVYDVICLKTLPFSTILHVCNSYTMARTPVRGDNQRAVASALSYVQVDKDGLTSLYHLHLCIPCTSQFNLCLSW